MTDGTVGWARDGTTARRAMAQQDLTTMVTGDDDNGDGATGDEVFNEQTKEQTNEKTNKQTNERTKKQTNKQTNKRTNKQMNERINQQKNERTSEPTNN